MFLQLQEQNDNLSAKIQDLNKKIELLIDQVTFSNKSRFGRYSEKMENYNDLKALAIERFRSKLDKIP